MAEYLRLLAHLLAAAIAHADNEAVKIVCQLNKQFAQGILNLNSALLHRACAASLSLRECEVARLVAFGYFNKHVAVRLGISEATMKCNVKHIMQKIDKA